jgi:TRAP-type C4-dicarboxylate transport system permease small subunit
MAKLVDGYFRLLRALTVVCLAGMVVLVFGNVVLRYAFNTGITVGEEVSRWLFVWLTFLGAIVATREHGHLGVDALVKRLPRTAQKTCLIASLVLMLFVTWLFLRGSWAQTILNIDVKAPATGASTGFFYATGVVFSVSVLPILFHDLFRVVTGRTHDEDLVIVKESEEVVAIADPQREIKDEPHARPKSATSARSRP